jgi:hypothetical protein
VRVIEYLVGALVPTVVVKRVAAWCDPEGAVNAPEITGAPDSWRPPLFVPRRELADEHPNSYVSHARKRRRGRERDDQGRPTGADFPMSSLIPPVEERAQHWRQRSHQCEYSPEGHMIPHNCGADD